MSALEVTVSRKMKEAGDAKSSQADRREAKEISNMDRQASMLRERDLESVIADIKAEKDAGETSYLSRTASRRDDMIVLHQATSLVCSTKFFLTDVRCKLHSIGDSLHLHLVVSCLLTQFI